MQRAAVILDRDGVINHDSSTYIKTLEEFSLIQGSAQAIADLHLAGWPVFIITNQSGIARGLYNEQTLADMHSYLYRAVSELGGDIQAIYYCPHHPDDHCACRKPQPGLFLQLALEHPVDLESSYYVGDKITDMLAARVIKAKPVLVKTGKGAQTLHHPVIEQNRIPVYSNLADFANKLLADSDQEE
ncbi:MAG: D-glycero-beta-D-manno-heptose 1,7-bisphosphate 7-phosphatase [Gammaproteobacteria bacterium]|nr:D-glycero-beta-D-manno-heptose 1,7-bisphosphate 7-phosphatase [Gammaproteobacteria bacterium]